MILVWLILIPAIGAVAALAAARFSASLCRWISLASVSLGFVVSVGLWIAHFPRAGFLQPGSFFEQLDAAWIPQWGIRFQLAADGLSLLLIVLTFFTGIVAVASAWPEIRINVGFFYFNLLFILTGIVGVFLAMDLFLFYFAWELMLVPMYFLIAMWGHERRIYAAVKFFIFTQLSGLLMLLSILGLYFLHGGLTGTYTFSYFELLGTPIPAGTAFWLMLGFFIAFAVKLPMVPFHTWLPDAHTEAPTAGSVILAALLLKTGGYGLIRFVVPLFPGASAEFGPYAMALGVAGIIYGAILAFGQTDLKRLVAYTSVSHLGFVLVGIFAWTELALQGAVVTMIAHGISTGALFVIAGAIQHRIHSRELDLMGGIWTTAPRMASAALVFAMASMGLPGLGDFIGEFLVLVGTFQVSIPIAVVGTLGIIVSTFYGLKFFQRAFHGPKRPDFHLADFGLRESAVMAVMIAVLLWIGLYPQPILRTFAPTAQGIQQAAAQVELSAGR